jgi:Raf kinase inhibitor-like YbhB/YbcL family protein
MKLLWFVRLVLFFSFGSNLHAATELKNFFLVSPAIQEGGLIPRVHACAQLGENRSPKLQWGNAPLNMKSFVLICNDPDAFGGLFIHWIVYNIPAQTDHFDEGIKRIERLPDGSMQGINSFSRLGYDGPCPPAGPPHRYQFTLYALDTLLEIEETMIFDIVQKAINGHVLGKARLEGIFQRQSAR